MATGAMMFYQDVLFCDLRTLSQKIFLYIKKLGLRKYVKYEFINNKK